jgi:hypothetical protein
MPPSSSLTILKIYTPIYSKSKSKSKSKSTSDSGILAAYRYATSQTLVNNLSQSIAEKQGRILG